MHSALTPKQQRFVDEYLIDLNATQAAVRAGYSKKTAYSQGQRLLKNVEIAAAIDDAKEARSERTKYDADFVLETLGGEVTADLADIYREDGTLKPIHEWPVVWRHGLVAGLEIDEIIIGGKKIGRVTKIKLSDRIRRLELMGKHVEVGAFSERKEIGGIGGGPIKVEDMSTVEKARTVAFAIAAALAGQGPVKDTSG